MVVKGTPKPDVPIRFEVRCRLLSVVLLLLWACLCPVLGRSRVITGNRFTKRSEPSPHQMAQLQAPQTVAPSVTRLDRPSWWAGHTVTPVRLLVRGQNLHGARVQPMNRALQVSEVLVNSAGTYLFVNVSINSKAQPGSYPMKLTTPQGSTTIRFSLQTPLATNTHFQGVTANDVIYLIMPDRFADGDQANNTPANAPAAANDRKNPRAYHGGDLRRANYPTPFLKEPSATALSLQSSDGKLERG